MKICIWMTKYFSLGGTKRVVTLIANELSQRHEVTIMCHQNRMKEDREMYGLSPRVNVDFLNIYDYVDDYRRNPHTLFRKFCRETNKSIGWLNRDRSSGLLAEAIFPENARISLADYINSRGYDVVIATGRMSLWLGMMAPYLHCKTVGWQHSSFDAYIYTDDAIFKNQTSLMKRFFPKLSAYIVLSQYDQRDYREKLGIETVVMTNPRSFTSEEKSKSVNKHFLMVTRFEYVKGLDMAMESFRTFAKKEDSWDLILVGSGTLEKEIHKMAEEYGISDRVQFIGYSNNPQQYYLESSVLLMPSRWEGWPMSVLEAYEYGLPVIAYHVAAMDLIIRDGETGLIVDAFDTNQFADAMLKLANDNELRQRMSKNAVEESGKYAIEPIGQQWDIFLESL